MKIKRFLAIILCLSLLAISVIGCENNEDDDYLYENGNDTVPSDTPAPTPDAGTPLEEAEEILRLLNEQVGSDNFIEFFREMMFEHSEDSGLFSFPEGYVFREGDMVEEFFDAAISLEYGEISGIVETMYGYHIILRVPLDFDSAPIPPPGAPPTSLRQLAAMEDFNFQRFQWVSAVEQEIVYSPEFETFDLAAVFENGPDFDESFPSFAPDTVMITSGDFSLSWAHFYIFLFRTVSELFRDMEAGGMEFDWHEEPFEGYTVEALVLEYALEEAISFISYNHGMLTNNIVLTDEDVQTLDESIEGLIEMYGSKEALEEALREFSGYYNFEIFMDLVTIEFGINVLVDTLYGDGGSEFPNQRVTEYAERNGYLMAMHILRMKDGF